MDRDSIRESIRLMRKLCTYAEQSLDEVGPDELQKLSDLFEALHRASVVVAIDHGIVPRPRNEEVN